MGMAQASRSGEANHWRRHAQRHRAPLSAGAPRRNIRIWLRAQAINAADHRMLMTVHSSAARGGLVEIVEWWLLLGRDRRWGCWLTIGRDSWSPAQHVVGVG